VSKRLYSWLKKQETLDVILYSDKINTEFILSNHPDLLISYNYRHVIRRDVISLMPDRILNMHISYLPWNRGAHPNVWCLLTDTPKGVTIHLIDEGIDNGDILFQEPVEFNDSKETLSSSYNILHDKIFQLFTKNWPKIINYQWQRKKQKGDGSYHAKKDFEKILPLLSELMWDTPVRDLKKKYEKMLGGNHGGPS
jgi:methionyl-tRNA formyltransferase